MGWLLLLFWPSVVINLVKATKVLAVVLFPNTHLVLAERTPCIYCAILWFENITVHCTRDIQEISSLCFISRCLTLMKAQLIFGVVSVIVALFFLPSQKTSEYCRCPSLTATGARRSAVRHWHNGVCPGRRSSDGARSGLWGECGNTVRPNL
jgi:hypothetical protein